MDGLATKDRNEVRDEILLNYERIFHTDNGTYITVKKVASSICKNEPTREQKKSVSAAMKEMFSSCRMESNTAYYSISMCRQRALSIATFGGDGMVSSDTEVKLPF